MGRRKQIRPHRSGGILERRSSEVEVEKDNDAQHEIDELVNIIEPFFIEIDKSTWVSEDHCDVSEILLLNLTVNKEFCGYKLTEEIFGDPSFSLRFKLSNVKEHIGRIKLGHWPVLSASNICLEFVRKTTFEGLDRDVVMLVGIVDGTEEGVTGLVHLCSLKYLTIRPILGIEPLECLQSIRIRVDILESMFDECESLLDNTRQLWKKSMMSVMAWLRPEVMTSEARYGCTSVQSIDVDESHVADGDSSAKKHVKFDVSNFYEAIKPSKEARMLEGYFPGLLPELRPYQRRAAYWMVQREKGDYKFLRGDDTSLVSPLCMPLNLIDTSKKIYYNPFSGNVSLNDSCCSSYVSGGILADEMGLGKTIELLACIFANQMPSSEFHGSIDCAKQVEKSPKNKLKRLKRERVECICGAVTESYKYKGLWVQCDICDAWQHADCVGYSPQGKRCRSREVSEEENWKVGNSRKYKKRKNEIEVIKMDDEYWCHTCKSLIQATESPIPSGATLIVCPTTILLQWHSEILRHTNPGSLRICIYEGVRGTSFSDEQVIDIDELLSADIVLTTYDVLKEDLPHDSERHEGDRRCLRREKRYPVVPTFLTRVLWWRICLDEAQMVEGSAAAATELALRLHATHRWCVTGTPIQQKLDDLYGLLKFLQSSPFDVFRWWTNVISDPYERGDVAAVLFTHKFFKQLMWRSSKAHVWDELQLPPQEESVSWLSLSAIEEHFYQRQHDTCVDDAREVVERYKNDFEKEKGRGAMLSSSSTQTFITNLEAAKLFNSLLKLRQACCHPQVGSSGLRSLQKSPMTMEEVLSVLIGKKKLEGEDALRKLVVALNGLAGIAMIKKDISQAVSLYREALGFVEKHSDDFRLDPLLDIHIHHNLADALSLADSILQHESVSGSLDKLNSVTRVTSGNIIYGYSHNHLLASSVNDPSLDAKLNVLTYIESLRAACEDLKQKFLTVFTSKLSAAQQDFRKLNQQVCDALKNRKNEEAAWWLDALYHVEQNKDLSTLLIQKIGEALSGNLNKKSTIPACFRSTTTLKYYIQTGIDALEESRNTLLDTLLELDQTMENPREEDIERVRNCKNCNSNSDGPACTHCELDEIFQVYEARLFRLNKSNNGDVIISAEEAVNLQKKKSALNQFYWNLSREEKISTSSASDYRDNGKKRGAGEKVTTSKSPSDLEIVLTIIRNSSRAHLERERLSVARKQLDLLEAMRREYALARSLATAQAQVLRAHDEIKMATSRLRLRDTVDDKSIDALSQEELDSASVENSSEKFVALESLLRMRGQLRYLKGLEQSNQKVKSGSLDCSSVGEVVNSANECTVKPDTASCPVCQEQLGKQKMVFQCGHITCCKCLFVMTERGMILQGKFHNSNRVLCPTCRQACELGNIALTDEIQNESSETLDRQEAFVTVQGSYSTKIEAITRRILWISSTDPKAKILVFSSWNDVLDVLQHAFSTNAISYIRMKGGRKSQAAISHFKNRTTSNAKERPKDEIESRPIQVLLLLIQHGANGLNLLEAQHVILVEPLLNPAAEAQAVGRVHRIGQDRKTLVHRFIVKDTVEESIYKMNKSRNTSSFVSGNRKNQDQPCLTLKDVESLFRVATPAVAEDEMPARNLRDLPASMAASIAAEKRSTDGRS